MSEGITPEQFKILSELRKEAKKTIKAEYTEILKGNRFTVLTIQYSEPCHQYYIVFKLNMEEHTVKVDKHEQMIALKQGQPSEVIKYIQDVIANKLAKIFLGETC